MTDYDLIADKYAAGIDERPWNALYERPATIALLPPVSGLDVLDAGCGHGWYAEWLHSHGARVVGYDRSKRMIELARQRLEDKVQLHHADGESLYFLDDASCDLILSALVLHYIEDLAPVFREWARVLRPSGRVILSTHHPCMHTDRLAEPGYLVTERMEERWGWLNEQMTYFRRPISAITEPLADAGFLIERIKEARPQQEMQTADPKGYDRLQRMPGFLHVRARKDHQ